MKSKILTLIIGILIGAVITTGVFLIINNNNKSNNNGRQGRPDMSQMGNFTPGENMQGMPGEKGERPNGNGKQDSTQNNNGTTQQNENAQQAPNQNTSTETNTSSEQNS